MLLSNLEYIPLRIFRKFFFTHKLISKIGKWIPYYEINQGQVSPVPIVDSYLMYCDRAGIDPFGKKILEIGPGATNSTGYEIIARTGGTYLGYEPYYAFDSGNDRRLLMDICKRYESRVKDVASKVWRIDNLGHIDGQSVDLILSYSVLEHVTDPSELIRDLTYVLKKNGYMIHLVDYRDHFFKYPFHFLQFSEGIWDTLLNPSDLPRYRVDDHLTLFHEYGFSASILSEESDPHRFNEVKKHISPRFKHYPEKTMSVMKAALLVKNTGVH